MPRHSLPNGRSSGLTRPVLPHSGDDQRTATKTDGTGTLGCEITKWSSWKGRCSKHGWRAVQRSSCSQSGPERCDKCLHTSGLHLQIYRQLPENVAISYILNKTF